MNKIPNNPDIWEQLTPEQQARYFIDQRLKEAGWILQNMKDFNPRAGRGVAVRELQTSTGPVDYGLFVDGALCGVVEAKKDEEGHNITSVEHQSWRYADSTVIYGDKSAPIRFVYEATGILTRFTDYNDIYYRSRDVFSFHRPETLADLLADESTLRNRLMQFPPLNPSGFRECQTTAIVNLEESFAHNHPRALIQMATGAGKTFTAITSSYRLLKYVRAQRILFLVDTVSLGKQAEDEFRAYKPVGETRTFSEIYGVTRLKSGSFPKDSQVYISTIQRMYSILRGKDLPENLEEEAEDSSVVLNSASHEVAYNPDVPLEMFDVIIIDECHRSIYNVWKQVLEYFDSYLVGLTATPDKRTLGFFNQNVVSEYTHDNAVVDGVNVPGDIFTIETKVGTEGAVITPQKIEFRDRLTREKRWEQLDEDVEYNKQRLDDDIVNPSQIRTVIRAFKDALPRIFPERAEVPKTLIFAKTDSHADDIIQIVREEFGEGNEFSQKITYSAQNAEEALSSFRNEYYPRIAVTVNMIATGTDVKPLECLLFMRDIKSRNYFEQMKGRGTRTLGYEQLRAVTPSATHAKDHYVLIDAIGVSKSLKTESRQWERKPSVSLKKLMLDIASGNHSEENFSSLASRLNRLEKQLSEEELIEFVEITGAPVKEVVRMLVDAHEPDKIRETAEAMLGSDHELTETELAEAAKHMRSDAAGPFCKPEVREFVENVRRNHDQLIDAVNIDGVTFSDWDSNHVVELDKAIASFSQFIDENRDEITALGIFYDIPYQQRQQNLEALKTLHQKFTQALGGVTIQRLWEAYAIRRPENVKARGSARTLTDLVSLIRFQEGYQDELIPFADRVNYNFMRWTMQKNQGNIKLTDEQMKWLRLIRDHIAVSLSVTPEDLELTPFDEHGGLGRFYQVFGGNYMAVLDELNMALAA